MKASRIHKPKARPANATEQDAMAEENQRLKQLLKAKQRVVYYYREQLDRVRGQRDQQGWPVPGPPSIARNPNE